MNIHVTACSCLTRVCAVDIAFAEHLDLLDLHGRAGAASLGQLDATDTLPPHGTTAEAASLEHWATLEIWAWSLAHPGQHWGGRAEPAAPDGHAATVAAIGAELTRLEDLLRAAGPGVPMDFFGRPGTSGDVARLLAHEAIAVAHAASTAAGRSVPGCPPRSRPTASRGHWSTGPSRTRTWPGRPGRPCCGPPARDARGWWRAGRTGAAASPRCGPRTTATPPSWSRARTPTCSGGSTTTRWARTSR